MREFWEQTKISIPDADIETIRYMAFGFLNAWFFGEFIHQYKLRNGGKIPMTIAHFHEWQVAAGLVLSRIRRLDIATVFTTHATLLGRHLCAGNRDFYNVLSEVNVDEEAGKRNIYHRYCFERASAASSHVFTTVSEITSVEAEHLLKRKADYILPNGLNVKKFSAPHQFQSLHAKSKKKIENFVRGHFHQYLDFDLDKTLYYFSAGRYEYRNKGVDMFIESLARLNHRLAIENSDKTVVVFLIFPAKTNSFNVDSMKAQATIKALRDTCSDIQKEIGNRLFDACMKGEVPNNGNVEWLTGEDIIKLKRICYARQANPKLPPICTHNMLDDGQDKILNQLRNCGLINRPENRVKVIFHPEFLSETSPLFPINYEEFVRGCHFGVFPSYYEPWGYTPAECTVMGVPNVSTNLTGFGCFMEQRLQMQRMSTDYGIYRVDLINFTSFQNKIEFPTFLSNIKNIINR